MIRLPLFDLRQTTSTVLFCFALLFGVINTTFGLFMIMRLPKEGSQQDWVLKEEYVYEGWILILIPISITIFIVIFLVKVLCVLYSNS